MSARTLDERLWWMRSLTRKAPTQWGRTFARSILRNAKRPGWTPSPLQVRAMDSLIDDHIASSEPAPELIEADS